MTLPANLAYIHHHFGKESPFGLGKYISQYYNRVTVGKHSRVKSGGQELGIMGNNRGIMGNNRGMMRNNGE